MMVTVSMDFDVLSIILQIKKCKEYISEVVLHAEAQASQYQHKVHAIAKFLFFS